MSKTEKSSQLLEFETYEQTQDAIATLDSRLPRDLLAGLAREVISRVSARDAANLRTVSSPSSDDIQNFARLLISPDRDAGAAYIADLHERGVTAEAIYLVYLAAAARQLGDWWTTDHASFTEVTIGSSRIMAIMRAMRHHFVHPGAFPSRSAALAAVPGENHTIGVTMVADFFRKDGWNIDVFTGLDHDELIGALSKTPYPIVGFSLAGEHAIEGLSRAVLAMRVESPGSFIVVGGQDLHSLDGLLAAIGIDASIEGLEDARNTFDMLWQTVQGRSA